MNVDVHRPQALCEVCSGYGLVKMRRYARYEVVKESLQATAFGQIVCGKNTSGSTGVPSKRASKCR